MGADLDDWKDVYVEFTPEQTAELKRAVLRAMDGSLVVIPAPGPVPETMFFRDDFIEWPNHWLLPPENQHHVMKTVIEPGEPLRTGRLLELDELARLPEPDHVVN